MFKTFGSKGGKDKSKNPTTGEAIQKLCDTEEMLQKKADFLEKRVNHEMRIIKQNAKTNRRIAVQAMKRKKRYDNQLLQIDGTLTTIEQQRNGLENANINTEVLRNIKQSSYALKHAHKNINADHIHRMMDEIEEQHNFGKEISDAIIKPVVFDQEFDDDELEAELYKLQLEEEQDKQGILTVLPLTPEPVLEDKLPDVPDDKIHVATKSKKAAKDHDFADLQKWAAAS